MLALVLVLSLGPASVTSDGAPLAPSSASSAPIADDLDEEDTGLSPRVFAYDPCLSLWQQLTCIGLSMIDQECFGGKGTAIYSLAVVYAGIGSVGGFAAGCLGGTLPGGLYASSIYGTEVAQGLGNTQALLDAAFGFVIVALVCGGAGSLAGIVLAGTIGIIHGLILLFTGQLEETGPLAGVLPEQGPGRVKPTAVRY